VDKHAGKRHFDTSFIHNFLVVKEAWDLLSAGFNLKGKFFAETRISAL
jgi:hypothetical protein